MINYTKKCTLFLICTIALNVMLIVPIQAVVKQKAASQRRKYVSTHIIEDDTQSGNTARDTIQEEESVIKKPTFKETWGKVLTLRWKQLGRDDLRNIGKPMVTIAALGALYYFWQKDIVPNVQNNNNNNPDNPDNRPNAPNNNPDHNTGNRLNVPNNNNLNTNNSNNRPNIIPTNTDGQLIKHVRLEPTERKKIARLCENDVLIDDVQHKIALDALLNTGFCNIPKVIQAGNVCSVAIHGNKIITGLYNNGIVEIYNKDTGELVSRFKAHEFCVNLVIIHGNKLVTGSNGTDIKIWNLERGILEHTLRMSYNGTIGNPAVAIHGDKLVIGGRGTLKTYVIHDNELELLYEAQQDEYITSIAINEDKIVTGSTLHFVRIWDIHTGQLLYELEEPRRSGFNRGVNAVAISGDKVISGSNTWTITVWDITSGQLLRTFDSGCGAVRALSVSGNKVFARGNSPSGVTVHDINTGTLLFKPIGYDFNQIAMQDDSIVALERGLEQRNALGNLVGRRNIVKVWSLNLNLNTPEFNNDQHPLFWIKHEILPFQANLIARAYVDCQRFGSFLIRANTHDAYIWITFPAHICQYLMERLNVHLYR